MRWRNYKLLTGDPGYPDYPIPIPPNETLSEEVNLGWVEMHRTPTQQFCLRRQVLDPIYTLNRSNPSTINVVIFLTHSRPGTRAQTLGNPYSTNSFDISCSTV